MYCLVLISLPHSLKSQAQLRSYWIGPLGRTCGPQTSDRAIAPQQRITPLPWPIHNGEIIYQVTWRDKYSRGLSHMEVDASGTKMKFKLNTGAQANATPICIWKSYQPQSNCINQLSIFSIKHQ